MGPFTELGMELLRHCELLDSILGGPVSAKYKHDDEAIFDEYLLKDASSEHENTRASLIYSAQRLADLASEPKEFISQALYGYAAMLGLQAVYKYKLASYVPLDGETTFQDISTASGLKEDLVRRFLQVACVKHIFRQTGPTTIRHTAASRLIASSQGVMDEIGFATEDIAFGAAHELAALEKYPDDASGATTEQNKTGFSVAYQTSDPYYAEFAKTPDKSRRFASAMREMTSGEAFNVSNLINGYDWPSLSERGATVVDVGGGQGAISRLLEAAYPGMKFVVQDLPAMTSVGEANLPEDKKEIIRYQVHDFFKPQPVQGDVFFLRWILHNWSDKYCIQILKNIVPGMTKPGAKVIVYEYVLPEVAQPGNRLDYYRRMVDLTMLSNFAGAERSKTHFEAIFREADPRFKLEQIIEREDSAMSILVFKLDELQVEP